MSVREAFNFPMHSEISVWFTFDAGHRIVGHKGKCARLHGHTYKIHVMAAGPINDPGFVVDFGDIKELVKRWDHKMLLWWQDPLVQIMQRTQLPRDLAGPPQSQDLAGWKQMGIVGLPFNPTAENMSRWLALEIAEEFSLESVMVELWETENCMARYVT